MKTFLERAIDFAARCRVEASRQAAIGNEAKAAEARALAEEAADYARFEAWAQEARREPAKSRAA
jgi:hypothetical protein